MRQDNLHRQVVSTAQAAVNRALRSVSDRISRALEWEPMPRSTIFHLAHLLAREATDALRKEADMLKRQEEDEVDPIAACVSSRQAPESPRQAPRR